MVENLSYLKFTTKENKCNVYEHVFAPETLIKGEGVCKSDTIIYLQSFDFTIQVLPIYFYDKKFQYETNKNMGLPSNQIKRAT